MASAGSCCTFLGKEMKSFYLESKSEFFKTRTLSSKDCQLSAAKAKKRSERANELPNFDAARNKKVLFRGGCSLQLSELHF